MASQETKPNNTSVIEGLGISPFLIGIAGLLEKFVNSFYWILVPLYLTFIGQSTLEISIIVNVYSLTWALLQIPMGYVGDIRGRLKLLITGFIITSIGVYVFIFNYILSALISGLGMSMVYPTLIAYVNDYCNDKNRGRSLEFTVF